MEADIRVERNVEINGSSFELLVTTTHRGCWAATAVHEVVHGHTIGGNRAVPHRITENRDGSRSEVAHLAEAMTPKCAWAGIDAGGQKTIVAFEADLPATADDKASILCEHIKAVISEHPGAVHGPDMNCGEDVQDAIVRLEPSLLPHVTGLSAAHQGLSIDSRGYTAIGIVEAIDAWSGDGNRLRTASIQGFGAVGAHTASKLQKIGYSIRAISNIYGCAIAKGDAGIDVSILEEAWDQGGNDAVRDRARQMGSSVTWHDDYNLLFSEPCEVFVPAAGVAIAGQESELPKMRDENPRVLDIAQLVAKMQPKLIAEAANYPLSKGAEKYLESQNIAYLPDVMVNCGGLIGCWVEWEARGKGVSVDAALHEAVIGRIAETVRANVHAIRKTSSPRGLADSRRTSRLTT